MDFDLKFVLCRQVLVVCGQGGDDVVLIWYLIDLFFGYCGKVLVGYWLMCDEVDLCDVMVVYEGLVCLLVVLGLVCLLIFCCYDGVLEGGSFGISYLFVDVFELVLQVLIVFLVGFDRDGNWLGYGGGFYDRILQVLCCKGGIMVIGFVYVV